MQCDQPQDKRDLYKTDVLTKFINLNERFAVPNKYGNRIVNANSNDDGVDQKIIDYRNRYNYEISNTKYQKITYKFHDPEVVRLLESKATSAEDLLRTFSQFEATKFKKAKKKIYF